MRTWPLGLFVLLLAGCQGDTVLPPDIDGFALPHAIIFGQVTTLDGKPVPGVKILIDVRLDGCNALREAKFALTTDASGQFRELLRVPASTTPRPPGCLNLTFTPPRGTNLQEVRMDVELQFVAEPQPPDSLRVDVVLPHGT